MFDNRAGIIFNWLTQKNIKVSTEWVEACLDWLSDEHNGQSFSIAQWQTMVMEQWHFADLREIAIQVLPEVLLNSDRFQYTGRDLMLQVMSAVNVADGFYSQLRKLEGTVNANALITTDDEQMDLSSFRNVTQPAAPHSNHSKSKESNRMLLLELTDGVKNVKAMEYKSIPELSLEKLKPGVKVAVRGPVLCRRGVLMLKSPNIEIIGGEVEVLSEEKSMGTVLRDYLAANIGLNVTDTPNLPIWFTSTGLTGDVRNIDTTTTQRTSSLPAVTSPTELSNSAATSHRTLSSQSVTPHHSLSSAPTQPIRNTTAATSRGATPGSVLWSSDEEGDTPSRGGAVTHSTPLRGVKRHLPVSHQGPVVRVTNQRRPVDEDPMEDDDEIFSQVVSEIENKAPTVINRLPPPATRHNILNNPHLLIVSDESPFCYIWSVAGKIFHPNFKEENWTMRGFVSAVISSLDIISPTDDTHEWSFKVRICDGSGFLDCRLADSLIASWMKIGASQASRIRDLPNGPLILNRHLQELKDKLSVMSGLFHVYITRSQLPEIRGFSHVTRDTVEAVRSRLHHSPSRLI